MPGHADYTAGITQRINDDQNRLSDAILAACLDQALEEYARRRPIITSEIVTGAGGIFLSLPAGWVDGFSALISIEELDSDNTPTVLSTNRWRIVTNPAPEGDVILRDYGYFTSGRSYRLTYTVRPTIGDADSTVPSADQSPLMDLAASHALLRLAAVYAESENPNFGTVTADYQSKTDSYRRLSKELRARYEAAISASVQRGPGQQRSWTRDADTLLAHTPRLLRW